MNLKPRTHEEPEINVVSLIDVVLLLVVFFMLVEPVHRRGAPAGAPAAGERRTDAEAAERAAGGDRHPAGQLPRQ